MILLSLETPGDSETISSFTKKELIWWTFKRGRSKFQVLANSKDLARAKRNDFANSKDLARLKKHDFANSGDTTRLRNNQIFHKEGAHLVDL